MTNTTHYNMTIAEGTDVVNPLTQIFPNFNTIDGAMFANKQSGIGTATEVTTGSVHAIVRANPDSNVFRFTATSAWTSGDTMTLDGNSVVVHMSDGTVPATGAYIIGAEVLAMVNAGLVTLAISSNGGVTSFNTRTGNVMPEASDYAASDIDFDNTNTTLTSTDVQGAIEEVGGTLDNLTEQISHNYITSTDTVVPIVGQSVYKDFILPNDGKTYICIINLGCGGPNISIKAGMWANGTAHLDALSSSFVEWSDMPIDCGASLTTFARGNGGNLRINIWTRSTTASNYILTFSAISI